MSKSRGKKSKVPKISEEEYAKYINALKSVSLGNMPSALERGEEEQKQTDKNS